MPTVLVLGANGRFGAAAVSAFASAGWRVLAQRRRPAAQAEPPGVHTLALPLADAAALTVAAQGAAVVVHAANPPYTRWDSEALPLARQGMDIAQRLGALFMLPGNVYNFGAGMPAQLHPHTPERPSTAKGRQRVQIEQELQRRGADGLASVVLRAGDFYGAGTGSWLDELIVKHLARGRLVYPGPTDRPHAWAYLPDLAAAFVALAARRLGAPAGCERLHFPGHTLTGRELLAHLEAAAAALGLRPPQGLRVGGVPWPLLRVAGLVHPMLREITRMSYLWRVPHALDGSALHAAVGVLPATPPALALRNALAGLVQAGALDGLPRPGGPDGPSLATLA
jgi:nucleoside-diphosphate-sugar epimerase